MLSLAITITISFSLFQISKIFNKKKRKKKTRKKRKFGINLRFVLVKISKGYQEESVPELCEFSVGCLREMAQGLLSLSAKMIGAWNVRMLFFYFRYSEASQSMYKS